MGVKSGRFVSRNNHTYEVRISGNNVADAELTLGVPPVIISMAAGGHKFAGFKSTTATINIITDTPLLDLYTERVDDILVEVSDVTGGAMQFKGYVSPYSFEQPMTGCTDSVTVNAVDSLTVRKEMKYHNIGDVHGVDLLALDIVQGIALRGGLTRIVQHINFNWETDQGLNPLAVMVAQAGFLQDEVSDCDALSAICQFFGYTACAIGDTLYLYDEHCMLHAGDTCRELCGEFFYDVSRGAWIESGRLVVDNPLSLQHVEMGDARAGISLSVERAYDGVQITPEGSEVSVLLPDVCDKDNSANYEGSLGGGTRTFQNKKDDADYIQFRTPRKSTILDLGMVRDGVITDDWSGAEGDAVVAQDWNGDGAMLLEVKHFARERSKGVVSPRDDEGVLTDLISVSEVSNGNMIHLKGVFPPASLDAPTTIIVGRQNVEKCYSHTKGAVEIELSCILMRWGNWIDIEKTATQGSEELNGRIGFIRLTCGGKVYDLDKPELGDLWVTDDGGMSYFYTEGNGTKLASTVAALSRMSSRVVVPIPTDGQIRVELGWTGTPAVIYTTDFGDGWNIYISALSVKGFGDSLNTACEGLRHSYSNREGGEYLSASTRLTTRHSDYKLGSPTGVNARPGVVINYKWNGAYMGRRSFDEAIPIAGILMEQLKARYGQPHAAYKMTAEGNIKPFAAVEWNGKTYTVEAYDRDIYDDTTTITID